MKISGKMCFMIILKLTKNQGSALSLEDTFFLFFDFFFFFFDKTGNFAVLICYAVPVLANEHNAKQKLRPTLL